MRRLSRSTFLSVPLAAFLGSCSTRPDVATAPLVEGLREHVAVHEGVSASGQPSFDHLRQLRSLGYRTIVNLRETGEDPIVAEERAWAAELSLQYVQIPVRDADDLRGDAPKRLGTVLENFQNYPILIHGQKVERVGALYAVYQGRMRGRTLEEALERGRKAGLGDGEWARRVREVLSGR